MLRVFQLQRSLVILRGKQTTSEFINVANTTKCRYYNVSSNFSSLESLDPSLATSPTRPSYTSPSLTSSFSTLSSQDFSRYGLGGHQWRRLGPGYQDLISTSLQQGVTLLEAGQEGGDDALAKAYRAAVEQNPSLLLGNPNNQHGDDDPKKQKVTITSRLGYRTVTSAPPSSQSPINEDNNDADDAVGGSNDNRDNDSNNLLQPGDVKVEEELSPSLSDLSKVLHNTSSEYIEETLRTSPLVELRNDYPEHIRLVYMVHNPEVQVLELLNNETSSNMLPSVEDRQKFIQVRLATAMEALEQAVQDGLLDSYGLVSNGLGLPPDHPLHMSHDTILQLLQENDSNKYTNFTTVQLPANLLETRGIQVAKDLQIHAATEANTPLDIFAMRPLTCYPDLGTGTGHPFTLIDFSLPNLDGTQSSMQYTNDMEGPPAIYQVAMQTALSHFDAEDILTAQEEGRQLTTEERETLDGCKLLQSMIHDLDKGLETVRSFAAHEDELYKRVIPLIYDTFEDFDEATGDVLQTFFAAYAVAVRYAIAKRTRQLLKTGEEGEIQNEMTSDKSSNTIDANATISKVVYPDIEDSMRLQEYALRRLLEEHSISRVIVGASSRDELFEDLDIIRRIASETSSS